jgi:ATP-dependent protease HslVU (ClpYQ) peptidase subunit
MDSLVFKKFDFKKLEMLEKSQQDIQKLNRELQIKGVAGSSVHINTTFNLLKKSAEEILQALLGTYVEVGKENRRRNSHNPRERDSE